ncbi:MAG TPA: hypothetical protein VLN48_07975 [Bryobacteraceae bacterium]|nr:hypothetical protein [Bryobacteraceae bacterium]
MRLWFFLPVICAIAGATAGQVKGPAQPAPAKTLQAQSSSSIHTTTAANGSQTVEIHNVSYEITGTGIHGRPSSERLVLRKTIHSRGVVGDLGVESTVTLEAWPFGVDLQQKPIYTLTQTGTNGHTVYPDLFVTDRRLEEVQWWSVHKLGSGQHLFDTYVPVLSFSISRDVATSRYAGLEVPPDDAKDARLKEPHVVGVITYASADRVIREALLTADDPKQAQLLRSYFGSTWTLKLVEGATSGRGKASEPPRSLKLSMSQNYPSPPGTIEVTIPISGDDLDLARAQLPPRLHVAAWKR